MPARPITDVYPFEEQCAVNIDHQDQEYRVRWSGDWRKPPNLSAFPVLGDAAIDSIPHSPEVDAWWRASQVIGHGSDSHIRQLTTCEDGFPICKIAINKRQRRLIEDEFTLLRHLSNCDPTPPVVQIHPEPCRDEEGIFGFRMEKLDDIPLEELHTHLDGAAKAIQGIHKVRVTHYDLSINNIMLNDSGRATLIDFGRAGFVGNDIPLNKLKGREQVHGQIYSTSWDYDALQRVHDIAQKVKPENY